MDCCVQKSRGRRLWGFHMTGYTIPTVMGEGMESYACADWHDYYSEVIDLIPPGSRVLDMGSGRGGFAAWLRDHRGCSAVCIDASAEAVESCRAKGLMAFQLDIDRSDVPVEGSFDAIVFLSSLESLIDPLAVVRRVRALLRPDGDLVIWLPNFAYFRALLAYVRGRAPKCIGHSSRARMLGVRGYDDVQFFTKETLEAMLVEAGYTNIKWEFREDRRGTGGWFRGSTLFRIRPLDRLRFLLSPTLCATAKPDNEGVNEPPFKPSAGNRANWQAKEAP
jgi:SAM-dependent methyltransferase